MIDGTVERTEKSKDVMKKLFEKFTLYELVICTVIATLGLALKQIVIPIATIVAGPLLIPKGALAGGLYMMWLIIGYGLVRKPGTALIISLLQALLVMLTGILGSHGILSLFTYLAPGLAVEVVMLLIRHRGCCLPCCVLGGLAANVAGVAAVNMVIFRVPGVYLVLVLSVAALSGMAGGWIACKLIEIFETTGWMPSNRGAGGEQNPWKTK